MTHILTWRGSLLRTALTLDAAITAANGLAYVALASPLSDLLGYSPSLLRSLGAFLLVFAAMVAVTATRTQIARPAVLGIVAVNGVWAAGSIVAVIAAAGSPETAGTVWTIMQAVVVGGFAELQILGLRSQR